HPRPVDAPGAPAAPRLQGASAALRDGAPDRPLGRAAVRVRRSAPAAPRARRAAVSAVLAPEKPAAPAPIPDPGDRRRVKGLGAAWNCMYGTVLIYKGPSSLDEIHKKADPVIVVAEYIPEEDLRRMTRTRVRGYVIERGTVIDPTYWFYQDENRAA